MLERRISINAGSGSAYEEMDVIDSQAGALTFVKSSLAICKQLDGVPAETEQQRTEQRRTKAVVAANHPADLSTISFSLSPAGADRYHR
jgi:hypothetical protein